MGAFADRASKYHRSFDTSIIALTVVLAGCGPRASASSTDKLLSSLPRSDAEAAQYIASRVPGDLAVVSDAISGAYPRKNVLFEGLQLAKTRRSVALLSSLLDSPSPPIRLLAIGFFSSTDAGDIARLCKFASDPDPAVRAATMVALSRVASLTSQVPAVGCLAVKDTSPRVQLEAVRLLFYSRDAPCLADLDRLYAESKSDSLRIEVLRALAHLAPGDKYVAAAFSTYRRSFPAQAKAGKVAFLQRLYGIDTPDVRLALDSAVQDSSDSVWSVAIHDCQGITYFPPAAIPQALAFESPRCALALMLSSTCKQPWSAAAARAAAAHGPKDLWSAAVTALADAKDVSGLRIAMSESKSPAGRDLAILALARLGDVEKFVADRVSQIVSEADTSTNWQDRLTDIGMVKDIKLPSVHALLRRHLSDEAAEVRLECVQALREEL